MKYIDALFGTLIAFVVFIIAVIFIPIVAPISGTETILTIATFLFAILAGFYISRLNSRYDSMRNLVATEDSYFLSLWQSSKLYGEKISNRFADLIDKYYILAFDFSLSNYNYKGNLMYFLKMWDEILELKKYRTESSHQTLVAQITEIEKCRKSAAAIASEKLNTGHWAVLIFLSVIILYSIFSIRNISFYSQVITVLLSTVLILILLIIRDLQNLMLEGKPLLEESGHEIQELISRPRYYNQFFLKRGISIIPKNIKVYRLGLHKPGSQKLEIKLITDNR